MNRAKMFVSVNGGWTSFGSYGSCSATCGGGIKTRHRTCKNPTPAYGGDDCHGSSAETTSCNTTPCRKLSSASLLLLLLMKE